MLFVAALVAPSICARHPAFPEDSGDCGDGDDGVADSGDDEGHEDDEDGGAEEEAGGEQ